LSINLVFPGLLRYSAAYMLCKQAVVIVGDFLIAPLISFDFPSFNEIIAGSGFHDFKYFFREEKDKKNRPRFRKPVVLKKITSIN